MSKIKITLSEFVSIELEESSALNFDTLDISPLIDEIVRGAKELADIVPASVSGVPALPLQPSQSIKAAGKRKNAFEMAYNAKFGKLVLNGQFEGMTREEGAKAKWIFQGGTPEEHATKANEFETNSDGDGIAVVMPEEEAFEEDTF